MALPQHSSAIIFRWHARLTPIDTKASKDELNQKLEHMEKANSKANRTVYAAETKQDGIYISPAVGKLIRLSVLSAGNKVHSTAINKEIEFRKIDLPQPVEKMKWYPRLEVLKKHELGILAAKPGGATKGGKAMTWKDVPNIEPQSEELKALIEECRSLLAKKRSKS